MSKIKISIIMPVYNAAKHIESTLENIGQQTLKELEVVIIDDGSKDNTIELIENYQKKDNRILLLKQQHKGSGQARNFGIKSAHGEYISFMDCDDKYCTNGSLEKMYNACHAQNANIGGGYRTRISDDYVHKMVETPMLRNFEVKDENGEWIDFRDLQEDYNFQSFIYKRDFLIDNDIMFPDYLRYQDPVFNLKALSTAEKFLLVPVEFYEYYFGHQNLMGFSEKVVHSLRGIRDNLKLAEEKGYDRLYSLLMFKLNNKFYDQIVLNTTPEVIEVLKEIDEINQNSKYKEEFFPIKTINSNYILSAVRGYFTSRDLLRLKYASKSIGEHLNKQGIYKVALYICLFPQLIAGPIVKYRDIAAQIEDREVNFDKV